jgi:hypothetical protein
MRIQNLWEQHPQTLGSYWLIKRRGKFPLADSKFGAFFFSCSSDIMEVPSAALCAFKMAGAALFYHVGA